MSVAIESEVLELVCKATPATAEDIAAHKSFWVDRKGNAYSVEDCGHYDWACNEFDISTCELENHGWIHLSYGNAYCFVNFLTRKQKDWFMDFCIAHSQCYDDYLYDVAKYQDDDRLDRVRSILGK